MLTSLVHGKIQFRLRREFLQLKKAFSGLLLLAEA